MDRTMHGRSITTGSQAEPEDKSGYCKPLHGGRFYTIFYTLVVSVAVWVHPGLGIVSQATPFTERKGLVTLQLLSCRRGMQLLNVAVR